MSDEFDLDEPRRRRPVRPAPVERDNSGSGVTTVFIILAVVAVLAFLLILGVVGLAIYGARQVSKSISASMAQIGAQVNYGGVATALTMYQAEHGHFPPPAMKTKDGSKGLSWRVAILPQLGYPDLYKQFKLDEAWNHPDNLKLASQMPYQFQPDNNVAGQKTHLRVFVGNGAMFEWGKRAVTGAPTKPDEIPIGDGISNTIMFVEAADAVNWMQPDELEYKPNSALPALGMPGQNYFFLATADGMVQMQLKTLKPANLKAAITANGGETFTWE
jgi:hypothetical protein